MIDPVRFIIITVPPSEVAHAIDETRRAACRVGGSRAALAYPPHITLRTGALVAAPEVPSFVEEFGRVAAGWDPFTMRTQGIWSATYLDGPVTKHLFGYAVAKDAPLAALNRSLLSYEPYRVSNRLDFTPHITLAFDDLDEAGLAAIQRWLAEEPEALPLGFAWMCDNVCLYRKENGAWVPFHVYRAGA